MARTPNRLLEAVASCGVFARILAEIPEPGAELVVGGLHGSAGTALVAALHDRLPERVLVAVADGPAEASAVEADFDSVVGEGAARLFPQREALPYESGEPHLEVGGLRVEAVEALFSRHSRLLVTTPRALQERAPVPERLASLRLTLRVGSSPGLEAVSEALLDRGFGRAPLVEEVGQFAVRGGIVDLFSFGSPDPVRIELWGDEIVSIRSFEIFDQRSTGQLSHVHVLPVDFRHQEAGPHVSRSLLELLPREALIVRLGRRSWGAIFDRTWSQAVELRAEAQGQGRQVAPPEEMFLSVSRVREAIQAFPRVVLTADGGERLDFASEPPPPVERDLPRLQAILRESAAEGRETLILCDNDGQLQRLEELLGDRLPPRTRLGLGSVTGGFALGCADPPFLLLTDHEIFRRSRRVRRARRLRGAVALESLAQLAPGDYVVHLDHGVGRFLGLERVEVGGQELESLTIEYAGGEILRVPVYRLDLVERWVGQTDEAEPPAVHRIGGRKWKTLRRKTEAAIEQMTAELLELYARRKSAEGFSFSADSRWQLEMESSFLYEDTPDQRRVSEEVKRDMESRRPMDRLVCGDVGYGKTEIAVRAAFKAVQDGKQVAILAPTTILVEQHRHTFEERLADYPVRVGALSRFRGAAEARTLLERLASGEVDIVIGTHRLLADDVVFRDLGLLVVDEEQRFGVRHKERLKSLRAFVDVLTLTATPIPRTLYMSLSRVRDLSLIRTPPRDRMPIVTHVLPWSEHLVAEALERELDREGQAFFLHNRVDTIHVAAERVRRLASDARVGVAHGQLRPTQLDRVMTSFVDGEIDVLVCSSIIENGLDVPNANTLIVENADRFGLSQLYQIRGRVGRSHRRAYCYLIVPPNASEESERRLSVLEHYTELGSGYSVALHDLELRGAGNLLGADQSGFAHAVGIDAYLRLLERTVERLRRSGEQPQNADPEVSMGGAAYLPEAYVSDAGQKLHLYRRLSKARRPTEVTELRRELEDRFGRCPTEVERLLDQATLRILGRGLGLELIMIRRKIARLTFHETANPRLASLKAPFHDRQIDVIVRRMHPLSLELRQERPEPLAPTLIRALVTLTEREEAA